MDTQNVLVEAENHQSEVLQEIRADLKREARFSKIVCIFTVLTFCTILTAGLIVIPKAVKSLDALIVIADQADDALDDVQEMSKSITETSEELSTLVEKNSQPLTESVQQLSDIDFDKLNQAINDLGDAVAPLASITKYFR